MCGIAAALLSPGGRPDEVWQEIRQVFTRNLISNQERGRDAAGVAVIQQDGRYVLLKQPGPAAELVETAAYQDVMAQLGGETVCLLGHARLPTKGSPLDNLNNHPLLSGHVLGIHNGYIHNDDDLFARLALPRYGQVDSEIIFGMLDTISPAQCNGDYLEQARQRITLLEGRFTTLSVDLRRPCGLLVIKKDMPLCVHYSADWQTLWFSSRYLFLRQAFGRSVTTEALPSRQIHFFDAQQLAARGVQPVDSLPCLDQGGGLHG